MKFPLKVIFILFLAVVVYPFDAISDPLLKGKIKVDGLSCPFCAYGMEKKLKAVSWIEDIEIFVDDGYVAFVVSDGKKLNTKALDKAIKNGGFTPKEIELTAEGIIIKSGADVMLKIKPEILLYLDPNAARERLLKKLEDTNQTLKITGKAETKKVKTYINIEKYEVP